MTEPPTDRDTAADQFAREHDPAQHDVSAGEEFRQRGDWTADEAGGEQVWDADGNLVEGAEPGVGPAVGSGDASRGGPDGDEDPGSSPDGRRVSRFEEVIDGGYSVGSAAPIDDGAMPLGHPVKAWEDSKTYATPDDSSYAQSDPHVWFTDSEVAEQCGFRHAG